MPYTHQQPKSLSNSKELKRNPGKPMSPVKTKPGNTHTDKVKVMNAEMNTLSFTKYRVPPSAYHTRRNPRLYRGRRRTYASFCRDNRAGCQNNEESEGSRYQQYISRGPQRGGKPNKQKFNCIRVHNSGFTELSNSSQSQERYSSECC